MRCDRPPGPQHPATICPWKRDSPAGFTLAGPSFFASEPVSRILSCAVIPLDAALPRTFISNLPGGFGNCLNRLSRAEPARRTTRFYRYWCVPPYLVLLRVGFTLPLVLQRERCALTAPFHPYPSGTGVQANLKPFRMPCPFQKKRQG